MDLVKLLNDLVASIAALQTQLADAQASAQALADLKYKEGFDAGVASGVVPEVPVSDKVYSQVELEAKISEVIIPLHQQIAGLQAQIDQIPAQIEQAKVEAIASFKAELASKYADMQVVEQAAETGFAELLK